ncbi:MAG: hypothetical protein LBP79_03400 [Clostridiales bacterium]|nr:hypothetical protein [Clostridiales bacterium]
MNNVIDKYKNKLIDYFEKDSRFRYEIQGDIEYNCMFHVVVKRNDKKETIRLRGDKITFWSVNDTINEEMTDEGFENIIKKFEYHTKCAVSLSRYNASNKRLGAFIWMEQRRLLEEEIIDLWNKINKECDIDASDVYYLTYETFFGDVKFRFKREGDGWARIE